MNYVREVADQFLARCSNAEILSPTDFSIIAEWEKQEVPLAVILKSINEVCDEQNENDPQIGAVADIQDKVKQDFINWLQTKGN